MKNSGFLKELGGIMATGKEASVFHGVGGANEMNSGGDGEEYAIKVYKVWTTPLLLLLQPT